MTRCTGIEELTEAATLEISGGDYVETTLGLVYGLAFGAGLLVASPLEVPLLAAAMGAGAVYELYSWL